MARSPKACIHALQPLCLCTACLAISLKACHACVFGKVSPCHAALRCALQGTLAVHTGRVELASLVEEVLKLARPLARPGVCVANRVSPFLPPARADAARLAQALYHLVTNACKFTEVVSQCWALGWPGVALS
jgi:hypothetical protein